MLKRQRILLGIVLSARQPLNRTRLFKLAFLLRQETSVGKDNSFYDFVPYDYGPYSFTLEKELAELTRFGFIDPERLQANEEFLTTIQSELGRMDLKMTEAIDHVIQEYGALSRQSLVNHVYKKYPWFASRSKICKNPGVSKRAKTAVYTIGYEGKSIEGFFNDLIRAGIKLIVDVRNNPISRKFGFSKQPLSKISKKFEIDYLNLPELGIPSALRKKLDNVQDYLVLLDEYDRLLLAKGAGYREKAASLVKEQPAALVCFEADFKLCHRSRLAEALAVDTGMPVIHL